MDVNRGRRLVLAVGSLAAAGAGMLVYAAPVDGGLGGVNSLGWSIAFGPPTVGLLAAVLGLRLLVLAAGGLFLLLALLFTPWGLGFYELPAAFLLLRAASLPTDPPPIRRAPI